MERSERKRNEYEIKKNKKKIENNNKQKKQQHTIYLLIMSAELIQKNVHFASVAAACAKYDFPVPGGPYNKIPLHGVAPVASKM